MINQRNLLTRIYCLLLLFSLVSQSSQAFAQVRKTAGSKTVAAAQPKPAAQKCSGAWTGSITYTRTQTTTNNKTVDRVSGRGQYTTNFLFN
jgi:hypothetical protein